MRAAITALAIAIGLTFVIAMFIKASHKNPAPSGGPAASTQQVATTAPTASRAATSPTPAATKTTRPKTVAAAPPATRPVSHAPLATHPITGLHIKSTSKGAAYVTLGSADPKSKYDLQVKLVYWGAGLDKITLSKYSTTVQSSKRYVVATPLSAQHPGHTNPYRIYPLAARWVQINGGKPIDLEAARWTTGQVKHRTLATGSGGHSKTLESVTYRLLIVNGQNKPVLEIERTYTVTQGSYDLTLRQKLINRSGKPLNVVWNQYAQGDVPLSKAAYLGDRRTFVTGYFTPSGTYSQRVTTTDGFTGRNSLIGQVVDAEKSGKPKIPGIWPNSDITAGSRLVWLGAENRYFAIATHPLVPAGTKSATAITPLQKTFPHIGTIVIPTGYEAPSVKAEQRAAAFTLGTNAIALKPGGREDLNMGVYAGPRDSSVFAKWPYKLMSFNELVRYEIECSWITFQWLAKLLLLLLKAFHYVVRDWGVAIILLVVLVRALLHPITKRSQINMMKMGKAMQSMQPEMEKLKKKYKDDQSKLNQEMMKLYREKGVNPLNMLGCLPMLLQTPIWIALYAMLYFAIELRHQHAFYGVFQGIGHLFGFNWQFLADLSSADHFWVLFKQPHQLNLILIHPNFQAINLLPILMAVVFFFQQKFMTPPAATEQAKQQQKMMKFMVLLFPIMLYSLPSGLNLYILASTAAGVVDSYIVRKHVQEQEAAGTLFQKKPPKKGGFMDRMQHKIAEKQHELERQQKSQQKKGDRGRKRKKR